MTQKTYTVTGMTCAHCVDAVIGEVSQITDVQGMDVDPSTGQVAVAGERFTDDQIRAAIEEAGYELAGTPSAGI